MSNNLLSNLTQVKYPFNYIFAGKTSFNISDGGTSYSYEVSICSDDYNLYFVRILNDNTNKYDYSGCFRISDDGVIKYFKGAKGKYEANSDEISILMSCIKGDNKNLVVNRSNINSCACCGKDISSSPELIKIGICGTCFNVYRSSKLKINPNWSIPTGLRISDIAQIVYPNNINYDEVSVNKDSNNAPKVVSGNKNNKGYSNRDLEILSAAEEAMSKTWGVYLDDNNQITQHVYVRTKDDYNIISEDVKQETPKVDENGFLDIPVGSTDAEILEKIFGSC